MKSLKAVTFRALALRQSEKRKGPPFEEGLTLETSVFKIFMVVNLRYQLNWYN